jgi:hypothetical protein
MSFRRRIIGTADVKFPRASDRNRFGFFQPPKKSLNLGVHPRRPNVGQACYDLFVIEACSHFADGHLEARDRLRWEVRGRSGWKPLVEGGNGASMF